MSERGDSPWYRRLVGRGAPTGALIGVLVGGLVGGLLVVAAHGTTTRQTVVEREPRVGSTRNTSLIAQPSSVRTILAKVEPAVVAITTGGAATDLPGASGQASGGAATGVVIDPNGTILTNDHVVAGAGGRIEVSFADGSFRSASIVGADKAVDLAVIKVDASGLHAASLGDSASLKVGDEVLAIGNALALQGGPSVTQGIVSGLGRQVPEETGTTLFDMVQTDAAVNPGNSGGALVNADGEVVGINTAVADPQEAQNVGFAIPIASARSALVDLERGASVPLPYLGVSTSTLTPADAQELDSGVQHGAVVVQVAADSPAAQSGIAVNDVIVQVGASGVHNEDDVANAVRQHSAGDRVSILFDRAGTRHSVAVTLAQRPSNLSG